MLDTNDKTAYVGTNTTREIDLLMGKDIKPITRREMYYRAIYHADQEIPEPITREEIALKYAVDYVRELEKGGS